MLKGRVILLNGPSSAGKSTLAETLKQMLTDPYVIESIDQYSDLFTNYISAYQNTGQALGQSMSTGIKLPRDIIRTPQPGMALGFQMIAGFHRMIAAKAKEGHLLIVDHVIEQQRWLKEMVQLCEGVEVIFIGVHCSLEELERREIKRGDRYLGLSRRQLRNVHAHKIYDLEIDTTSNLPETCAAIIVEYLRLGEVPMAFAQLRKQFADDEGL